MTTASAYERKERIVQAALQVFSSNGYDAGSVNDVAAAAGMTRHNLFYYFPNKRELLLGVLDSRDADLDSRLNWMSSAVDLPLTKFAEELVALQPEIYRDRELMRLYHRLTAEAANPAHPAHGWVKRRYARLRTATTCMLEAAQHRGEITDTVDTDGLAIAVLAAIEGIEAQWLVDDSVAWNRGFAALQTLVGQLTLVRP